MIKHAFMFPIVECEVTKELCKYAIKMCVITKWKLDTIGMDRCPLIDVIDLKGGDCDCSMQ